MVPLMVPLVFLVALVIEGGKAQTTCKMPQLSKQIKSDYFLSTIWPSNNCISNGHSVGGAAYGFTDFTDGFEYLDSYGWAVRDTILNCPYETNFAWASLSKSVAGVVAANLAFEGILDLDNSVYNYLFQEGFEYLGLLARCDGGPIIRGSDDDECEQGELTFHTIPANDRAITTRQLLSNKAGLPHYANYWYEDQSKGAPGCPDSTDENLNKGPLWGMKTCQWWKYHMIAEPGTVYSYSSYGFNLAGAVMEKVSGLSYWELVKKYVRDPLGLSTLRGLSPWATIENEARGYHSFPENCLEAMPARNYWHLLPSGGLFSSLADLHTYTKALAAFDTRLLPTKLSWIDEGKTPANGVEDALTYFWEIRRNEDARDMTDPDTTSFYSMGLTKNVKPEKLHEVTWNAKAKHHTLLTSASHSGGLPQISSYLQIDWFWTEAPEPLEQTGTPRVRTIMSNYMDGDSVWNLRAAIDAQTEILQKARWPLVEYGNDNGGSCPHDCPAAEYRTWLPGMRMTFEGITTVLPKQPNASPQNEPLALDFLWNENAPHTNCRGWENKRIDAVFDRDGRHGKMIEAEKVINGQVPPMGTGSPHTGLWLFDFFEKFGDTSVDGDSGRPPQTRWAAFKNRGFWPVTMQGIRRADGAFTCFVGTWAFDNHFGEPADWNMQVDVPALGVPKTGQAKKPTSVSLYWDEPKNEFLTTIIWKDTTAADSANYMIPRDSAGSAGLPHDEFKKVFNDYFNKCEFDALGKCYCWVPILIDVAVGHPGMSYSHRTDHYLSVWQKKSMSNVVLKLRMPEPYFTGLIRLGACAGYEVTQMTRFYDFEREEYLVAAIWEKVTCPSGDIQAPTDGQCDPKSGPKTRPDATATMVGDDTRHSAWGVPVADDSTEEFDSGAEPVPWARYEVGGEDLPSDEESRKERCEAQATAGGATRLFRCNRGEVLITDECGQQKCARIEDEGESDPLHPIIPPDESAGADCDPTTGGRACTSSTSGASSSGSSLGTAPTLEGGTRRLRTQPQLAPAIHA
uniref:Beta-lactamase-related domain-containing protein n=1 Tax=Chromera velia CCMP2878 TaxID=1169474 RepID=A0A0G4HX14_9ALVE|eukprot:Cvel_9160.t1-p1 / transcript=Cvel_9160.t1 / gene=Cvel_9160 / organism=Chromera_velia_CCMP2878 / gene_product=hypothetical protein / transcript_product=hypothetical protein / location=Cvel_scaffold521:56119-62444(-) / protein_length=1020 / sequence_SO=supercontig / SO=protein_coding / is_pseudo=false